MDAELQELKRKRAKLNLKMLSDNDLYVFSRHTLGYPDIRKKPHREICNIIHPPGAKDEELEGRRLVLLVPRGTFKTTITTISYALFRLMRNPMLRILLGSAVWENSRKMLSAIKSHIQHRRKFIEYYGRWNPPKNEAFWNMNDMTILPRVKMYSEGGIIAKEPSIVTTGADSSKVSQHFDIIIPDDPHNPENTRTKERRQKVIDWFKDLISLLDDPDKGEIIIPGTPYTDDDLYAYIEENLPEFKIFRRDCYNNDINREDLLFPSRFNHDNLKKIRIHVGPTRFNSWYLLDPKTEESQRFPKKHRQWVKEGSYRPVRGVIGTDTAESIGRESDFSAIVIACVDTEGRFIIEFAKHYKMLPYDYIEEVFKFQNKSQYKYVTWEKARGGIRLEQDLKAEMKKKGQFFKLIPMKRGISSKNDRIIDAIQAKWEADSVYFVKGRNYKDLFYEMEAFPRGKNDDILDCMADCLTFLTFRKVKKPKEDYVYVGNEITGKIPVPISKLSSLPSKSRYIRTKWSHN